MRPFGKFDFGNQLGLHEMNFSQPADLAVKRIPGRLQRLERCEHFLERLVIEAGAGLANMDQSFLLVVESEDERAKIFAAAFGIGVATDDAFLALCDLDF